MIWFKIQNDEGKARNSYFLAKNTYSKTLTCDKLNQ